MRCGCERAPPQASHQAGSLRGRRVLGFVVSALVIQLRAWHTPCNVTIPAARSLRACALGLSGQLKIKMH